MSGNFDQECDRLSRIVDPEAFDQAEWASNEGKILADIVVKIENAFKSRKDFYVIDQLSQDRQKRLILANAVEDGIEIANIHVNMSGGQPVVWASEIDGGNFQIVGNRHHRPDRGSATEEWVRAALAEIMSSIQRRQGGA